MCALSVNMINSNTRWKCVEKNLPKGKSKALPMDIEAKLVLPNYSFGFPGARSQLTVIIEIQFHPWPCKIHICLWTCGRVPDNIYDMHTWYASTQSWCNIQPKMYIKHWEWSGKSIFWKLRIFWHIYYL